MPKDPREVGALWLKTSAKGVEYMSGTILGKDVVCFREKATERGPTWRVLESQPREGGRPPQRATPPKPVHDAEASDDGETVDDGDIPF
jgi:hypothetical protein